MPNYYKLGYFLKNTTSTLKKTTKRLDKRVARSIGSLTKKHSRKWNNTVKFDFLNLII